MNKWIAIPVISVLAVAVIGGGYFLWQQTSKLGDAESEIVSLEGDVTTLEGDVSTLEGNVSTLEGNVATLEGNVSTLETDLAESEAAVTTLETDLESVNSQIGNLQSDVSTQRTINSSLSAELKKVQYPRHFQSIQELTDWLYEDDTDTVYANEEWDNLCYILQVRALRDGFLLPVAVYEEGPTLYMVNSALIGDSAYYVWASDDYTEWQSYIQPVPSYPLPLD